jgi:hypothetical protein
MTRPYFAAKIFSRPRTRDSPEQSGFADKIVYRTTKTWKPPGGIGAGMEAAEIGGFFGGLFLKRGGFVGKFSCVGPGNPRSGK